MSNTRRPIQFSLPSWFSSLMFSYFAWNTNLVNLFFAPLLQNLSRKCSHCKKNKHTINCCWYLHPENKNMRSAQGGRFQSVRKVAAVLIETAENCHHLKQYCFCQNKETNYVSYPQFSVDKWLPQILYTIFLDHCV